MIDCTRIGDYAKFVGKAAPSYRTAKTRDGMLVARAVALCLRDSPRIITELAVNKVGEQDWAKP